MVGFLRRVSMVLGAAALSLGGVPAVAQARQAGPFSIAARHSGLCLEVDHGRLDPGTRVLQWNCHRGQHQLWRINDLGNGYVQLVVEHSAQCLEVDNAGGPGAYVLQWPCHGGTHQQWRRSDLPGGFHRFMARHSGLCLEVEAANLPPGSWVLTWHCHDGAHQQWSIR
ncbi:RICIN domain-containing protein [Amycolatopsis samaneae]|uniref:RICIN domain-containing protein n=1 Tax=Amycolatopsis samaneae TaxID=664691 RepID=A0ABW5GUE0_9PSEU